ncbi:hypothetical protein ANCDUO_08773 [Ancylostoma duodenale]|uniref:Uncharacterized protein n=1 Tax=Ancylostoma duodenale TaxID=51022 RepID=A0A0C2GIE6_9BILA|nr:hypothetical protein ANCDUO_08773 [Ancylostoma duodenale]
MQHLEDTIAFRKTSYEVLQRVPDRDLEEADADDIPRIIIDRLRPVLYQVVSTSWGTGVILEAKNFFTVGPDRRKLHCIILDQHTINRVNYKREFDKTMV